jgi:hypothetical protein
MVALDVEVDKWFQSRWKPPNFDPQQHKHDTSMRSTEEMHTGDERQRERLSPVVGRRSSRDPVWKVEEMTNDDETWDKTFAQSRGQLQEWNQKIVWWNGG